MAETEAIPRDVIRALNAVRAGGLVNMHSQRHVVILVSHFNEEAANWLEANGDRYIEALGVMAQRQGARAMQESAS